ncbi:hypothetical protein EDD85DRAFT_996691 [Armillaria nabsnona]|nr:hypothetical protein EDD85DRAFT_996691 [Armillaria nabsnona]
MNPPHASLLRSGWPSFYLIPPMSHPVVVAVTMRSLSLGSACRLILARVGPSSLFSYRGRFVHPGLLHTADDFVRIKKYVFEEPTEPWVSAFASSRFAQVTRTTADAQGASYADVPNALIPAITDDKAHATKGIERASFLTVVNGTDSQLATGLQGKVLVNAAENL